MLIKNFTFDPGQLSEYLIEAYDAIHNFDIIAISESMLDSTIEKGAIHIKGFSPKVFRNDHTSNPMNRGVFLYHRTG